MRKSGGTRGDAKPWTRAEDCILRPYLSDDVKIRDIADLFPERTRRSVEGRLWRLRRAAEMTEHDRAFLAEIDAFRSRYRLSQRQFGIMAAGSPALVYSLRSGRHIGEDLEQRLRDFMAAGDPRPRNRFQSILSRQRKTLSASEAAERQQRLFRDSDPHERAKTFIRSRGFACFNAEILHPTHRGRYFVGAREVSGGELLEFARRRGWEG